MKIKFEARLAFPSLFEPEQFQGEGNATYGCTLLIPGPTFAVHVGDPVTVEGVQKLVYKRTMKLADVIDAVGKEKWKDKWPAVKRNCEAKDLNCLHNGDQKSEWAGFAGHWYVSCRSPETARPKVVDINGSPLTARDGRIYAGCYVIGYVEVWGQENSFGKRVNAQIRGVQFLRDGDAFGGAAPASDDEFEDLSQGADADDIG